MLNLGELKLGEKIGYKTNTYHMWVICPICNRRRWYQVGRKRPNPYINCGTCIRREMCKNRIGEKHPNWKGGKWLDKTFGYAMMTIPKNDPLYPEGGEITEHRYIMARKLERPLFLWEIVHHKNGIKTDNREENLEITTRKLHYKNRYQGYTEGYKDGYWQGYLDAILEMEDKNEGFITRSQ